MSFIVTSDNEAREECRTINRAKLIAGEWQIERDRLVIIEKTKSPRRRWKATLLSDGSVKLTAVFCDPYAADRTPPATRRKPHELKYVETVIFPDDPDLERARRVRKYADQWEKIVAKYPKVADLADLRNDFDRGGGQPKCSVLQLDESGNVIARHESILAAANAANVSKQSMQRRLRNDGSGWVKESTRQRSESADTIAALV